MTQKGRSRFQITLLVPFSQNIEGECARILKSCGFTNLRRARTIIWYDKDTEMTWFADGNEEDQAYASLRYGDKFKIEIQKDLR